MQNSEVKIDTTDRIDGRVGLLFTKQNLWRDPEYMEVALTDNEVAELIAKLQEIERRRRLQRRLKNM